MMNLYRNKGDNIIPFTGQGIMLRGMNCSDRSGMEDAPVLSDGIGTMASGSLLYSAKTAFLIMLVSAIIAFAIDHVVSMIHHYVV